MDGVSPSCRVRIGAMSDATLENDYRKYRNLNLICQARPAENGHRKKTDSATSHDSMSKQQRLIVGTSEARLNYDTVPPTLQSMKRKSLHKLASGALANIGSLFGANAGEDADARTFSGGHKAKAVTSLNNTNDFNFDFNDSGMQNKLSQKERFFSKPWRNRQKMIPNAGNSLWRPEVRFEAACTIINA